MNDKEYGEVRERVLRDISYRYEGSNWDYKRQWHSDKSTLLHDIMCLANNLDDDVSFLIIGVDDKDENRFHGVRQDENRRNTQQLTDWITSLSWFGGRWPKVEVISIPANGVDLDVVIIKSKREDLPYCLDKPYGEIKALSVYVRRNDTNTPINKHASPAEVEALWRRHFGLDLEPLLQMKKMLRYRADWSQQSPYGSNSSYYKFDPRYVIDHEGDPETKGRVAYMVVQEDPTPYWYWIHLYYSGSLIYECQGVNLDGGRCFTVAPERGFFTWPNGDPSRVDISYHYFEQDSLEWSIQSFFNRGESPHDEYSIAYQRFIKSILVFRDKEEREGFLKYLRDRKADYQLCVASAGEPFLNVRDINTEEERRQLANELRGTTALQEMLDEYRYSNGCDIGLGVSSRIW